MEIIITDHLRHQKSPGRREMLSYRDADVRRRGILNASPHPATSDRTVTSRHYVQEEDRVHDTAVDRV